jgi:hypothetical protein
MAAAPDNHFDERAQHSRVFPYEAFLSHNRDDESSTLLEKLRAHDVIAWHDGNADLRDRRVQRNVATALRASRYIVVCVGSKFRTSPWVRAEYLPGLAFEARHRVPRVLVPLWTQTLLFRTT